MNKSPDAFRTISEVADWLGVQAHVLRFWESKFNQVKPVKRAGGRRYYRPADMQLLGGIKKLLHDDGLTIKGVQKILREQGVGHVSALSQPLDDAVEPETAAEPATDTTVLRFRDRRATQDRIEDATLLDDDADADKISDTLGENPVPAAEAAKFQADEPDAASDGDDAQALLVAQQMDAPHETEPAKPEATPLPAFMHRSAEDRAQTSAAPGAPRESDEPSVTESRRTRSVDAPDPPDEGDLPYHPGAIAHLAKLDRLTPAQASRIAPLAGQLRDWLNQSSRPGAA